MSRTLAAGLVALLLAVAAPAYALAEPTEEPTEVPVEEPTVTPPVVIPCANDAGLEVVTVEGLESTISTPSFELDETAENKQFLVDLGASSVDATAAVTMTMTWDVPMNDFDLAASSGSNSGLSENWQPVDPAEESVFLASVRHCAIIDVSAINFFAPVPLDTLSLEFGVGTVKAPPATTAQ